jgi:large subunit ribosomal protein L5
MNNTMRTIRIEKVTLNIGAGKDVTKLEKGMKILKAITGIDPVKTVTQKRLQAWGLRPGLPIGCKITVRKKGAEVLLQRLIEAREFQLKNSQFDNRGNLAFGIPEYIDIPGIKYDPQIGISGLEVCVTLERPGFRIKRRRSKPSSVGKRQTITKVEAIDFMKQHFKVTVGE